MTFDVCVRLTCIAAALIDDCTDHCGQPIFISSLYDIWVK